MGTEMWGTFLKNTLCTAKLWHKKILVLTFMRSEVLRWLHTLSKYSSPWFPHRKKPCDVSDDPEDRIRAINRKWLSSKLHPIIITAKKTKQTHTDKQSQITTRHKVTDNTDKRPQNPAQTFNSPKKSTWQKHKQPPFMRRFPEENIKCINFQNQRLLNLNSQWIKERRMQEWSEMRAENGTNRHKQRIVWQTL